ncbi:MAG TPA: phosphatase PAP2 family protein, partial [Kofleriaceae bacterium]|nr:phosphatase PAP2 family protein [Kofleriaceae bacterium]
MAATPTTTTTTTTNERKRLPWRELILFAIAALATFTFVAIADELREGDLDKWDTAIAIAIHQRQTPVLDYPMITLTAIGTGPTLIAVLLGTSIWCWRRKRKSFIVIFVANCVSEFVLNPLLKTIFSRARPTLFEVITRPETFSFPSGHAMSAMAVYGGLAAVVIALRPTWRPIAVIAATILVFGIGISRVYLGAHWPFDV